MPTSTSRSRATRLHSALGGWPRRVAALLCLAIAIVSAVRPRTATSDVPSSIVLVVSRDLPAGSVLTDRDIATASLPNHSVPHTAIRNRSSVVGRPIGAAMARGEPLTAARLLDTSITESLSSTQVAATITLSDQGQAAIVHAGAAIDVYLAAGSTDAVLSDGIPLTDGKTARALTVKPIASDVRVIAVQPHVGDSGVGNAGLTLVVAVSEAIASQLSNHPSGPFVATLRPPS